MAWRRGVEHVHAPEEVHVLVVVDNSGGMRGDGVKVGVVVDDDGGKPPEDGILAVHTHVDGEPSEDGERFLLVVASWAQDQEVYCQEQELHSRKNPDCSAEHDGWVLLVVQEPPNTKYSSQLQRRLPTHRS